MSEPACAMKTITVYNEAALFRTPKSNGVIKIQELLSEQKCALKVRDN